MCCIGIGEYAGRAFPGLSLSTRSKGPLAEIQVGATLLVFY